MAPAKRLFLDTRVSEALCANWLTDPISIIGYTVKTQGVHRQQTSMNGLVRERGHWVAERQLLNMCHLSMMSSYHTSNTESTAVILKLGSWKWCLCWCIIANQKRNLGEFSETMVQERNKHAKTGSTTSWQAHQLSHSTWMADWRWLYRKKSSNDRKGELNDADWEPHHIN